MAGPWAPAPQPRRGPAQQGNGTLAVGSVHAGNLLSLWPARGQAIAPARQDVAWREGGRASPQTQFMSPISELRMPSTVQM